MTGLRVNGQSVTATWSGSTPSAPILLPNNLGTVILNEQITTASGLTVDTIHIHTTTGQDFIFGSAAVNLVACSGPKSAAIAASTGATACVATSAPAVVTAMQASGTSVVLSWTGSGTSAPVALPNNQGTVVFNERVVMGAVTTSHPYRCTPHHRTGLSGRPAAGGLRLA